MNVAIYCRVSTNQQDSDMQLSELRNYCQQKSWNIAHEYVDKGISGAKTSRPQLDRMMRDASEAKLDAVLVWKLDRFGRSLKHLLTSIEFLESFGVSFISFKDAIDLSTPQGRLLFQLLAAMAEFERELIRERTRSGLANAKRKGVTLGRPSLDIQPEQVRALKDSGATWNQVSETLSCSPATAKRAYGSVVEKEGL